MFRRGVEGGLGDCSTGDRFVGGLCPTWEEEFMGKN